MNKTQLDKTLKTVKNYVDAGLNGKATSISYPSSSDAVSYIEIATFNDADSGNIHAEAIISGSGNFGTTGHLVGIIRLSGRSERCVELVIMVPNTSGTLEIGYVRDSTNGKTTVYLKRGTYDGGGLITVLSEMGCSFKRKLTSTTTAPSGYTTGTMQYMYSTLNKPTPADIGAAASHSHSYLPLSGGTLSGKINVSGESTFYNGTYVDPWNGQVCSIKASGHVGIGGSLKVNGKLEVDQDVKSPVVEATTDLIVNRYGYNSFFTNNTEGTYIHCDKNNSAISLKDNKMFYANSNGSIEIGPQNPSHCHIYTDSPSFYFNKELIVNGRPVWHTGNFNPDTKLDAGAFTIHDRDLRVHDKRALVGFNTADGNYLSINYDRDFAEGVRIHGLTKIESIETGGKLAFSNIGSGGGLNANIHNLALHSATGNGQMMTIGDDNKIYLGNPNTSLVIESHTNPVINVNRSLYQLYHTGNKPTVWDIGAYSNNGGDLYGNMTICAAGKRMYMGCGESDTFISNSVSEKYLQLKNDGRLCYSDHEIFHGGNYNPWGTQILNHGDGYRGRRSDNVDVNIGTVAYHGGVYLGDVTGLTSICSGSNPVWLDEHSSSRKIVTEVREDEIEIKTINAIGLNLHLKTNGPATPAGSETGDIVIIGNMRPDSGPEGRRIGSYNYRFAEVWTSNGTVQGSDERYKTKIKESNKLDCFEMVKNVKVFDYTLINKDKTKLNDKEISLASEEAEKPTSIQMGVMAQHLLPYECSKQILVHEEEHDEEGNVISDFYGINAYNFSSAIMAALQVEISKREAAEERIVVLEKENQELKDRLAKIEAYLGL